MSDDRAAPRFRPIETLGWLLASVFLLALRVPHLRGPLDDPHSWRQCDTVAYTRAFARHGIDLLHPSVCWLGAHRTLIFEFPLPEAMAALLYRAFHPDPLWDRLVTLAFFVIATGYLHAIVRSVAGSRPAWLATVAYLALPLGQFYSRAAQVDFAATAGAHALLFHAIAAFRSRSLPHATVAAAAGTMAALVKAPYVLPVLGPLVVAFVATPGLSALALAVLALGLPAATFALWRQHVDAVNAAVPDWTFLPGFYKESEAGWWYFGEWKQRLDLGAWLKLARRLVREAATPLGVLAMLPAFVPWLGGPRRPTPRRPAVDAPVPTPNALVVACVWLVATLAYLIVFFPLNVIHSYYQIPFLAPFAMLMGLGAARVWARLPRLGPIPVGGVLVAMMVGLVARSGATQGYYRIDHLRVIAGERLQTWVPPGDLIVASDPTATHSDPRLLHRADREGWPVGIATLTPAVVDTLTGLGARWLAVVTDRQRPELVSPAFLATRRVHDEPIVFGADTLGTLELFRLQEGAGVAGITGVAPAATPRPRGRR